MDIVLVTNGPAEMNSLVRPVAYRAALAFSAADIWVFASPGSGATDREVRVASAYRGVRRAFSPRECWRLAIIGMRPTGFTVSQRGAVVNLGASPFFAAAVARRLKYPLIHYVAREYPVKPKGSASYLTEDERVQAAMIAAGAPPPAVKVIGDLALDVVTMQGPASGSPDAPWARQGGTGNLIGLFPGESLREARRMVPFMLKSAELLARVERGSSFMLRVSPFVGTASLENLAKGRSKPSRSEGASASIDRSTVPFSIVTAEGLRVPIDVGPDNSALYACDAVLTAPGLICHELAYAGAPYVVTAPRPKRRGGAAPAAAPVMRVGRTLVREVVGTVRPEDVVIPVVEMLSNAAGADRAARELKEAVGLPGAVDAVIQSIRTSVSR